MTVVATYPKVARDWLKHELDPTLFRKGGIIKSGSGKVITGTVLGAVGGSATAAAKAGGNTGGGTLTLDATTPVLAGAKDGVYSVRCIAAAANSGTFRIENPDGVVIGDVLVGATFADGIKFVIADVGADFAVGDGFDISVSTAGKKYIPLNFAGVDGSQKAVAILIHLTDATSEDVEGAVLTGHAQIVPSHLVWPVGATTDQKTAALAQLAALGIVSHQRF